MARRTLAQIRSTVLRRVGNSAQLPAADATAIIADVHKDIATAYQWSQRRRETRIQTKAPYSTGTVSLTSGSGTVTGSGTVWTAAMAGAAIAIAGEASFFYIRSIDVGLQTLELGDGQAATAVWGGASASGATYRIFRHQYAMPSNVAVVLGQVRQFPLIEKTRTDFDEKDAERTSQGEPTEYALVRTLVSGAVESIFLELWPVPDQVYDFRTPFLIEPPELAADDDIPVCPPEPIEWRAAAEAAWFIYSKTGDARWNALGQSYYQVYAGDEQPGGTPGVLHQALRDDQHRFGLPPVLGGREVSVGLDRMSERDWEAM